MVVKLSWGWVKRPGQAENKGKAQWRILRTFCENNGADWWTYDNELPTWATHIFREHNKEADLWAAKGAKGHVDEWVDAAHVVWSEVSVSLGFGMAAVIPESPGPVF